MAAGCTIAAADFEVFRGALQGVAREGLDAATLERTLISDGPLAAEHFDPATVRSRATYDEPKQFPEGIPYVFVNGVAVVERGEHTGATPGRALRRGRALV